MIGIRNFVHITGTVMVCFALFMFAASAPALANRVALVIGNGAYAGPAALPNPPKDAAAVAEKLRVLNFDVSLVVDATLPKMRQSLEEFGAKAEGAEVALIFFSGHGLQVDGKNYLVPVSARLSQRGDLDEMTLGDAEIWDYLLAAAPEVALLILDACRDNPFSPALSASSGLASGSVSASAFVQRPNTAGMLIGFAAAPGAIAFDGTGSDGNSPFTTALLKWMDRPGLEVGTMFRRVRGTVLELTRGAQVPWVEEALLRDVFFSPGGRARSLPLEDAPSVGDSFALTLEGLENPIERRIALEFYARLTGADLLPASAPTAQAAAPDEDLVREGLIWLSIKNSRDADAYQKFIATYPGSSFAALAERELAGLQNGTLDALPPLQLASVSAAQPGSSGLTFDRPQSAPIAAAVESAPQVPARTETEVRASGTGGPGRPQAGSPVVATPPSAESGVRVTERPQTAPQPDPSALTRPGSDADGQAPGTTDLAFTPVDQAAPDRLAANSEAVEALLALDRDELRAVQRLLVEGGDYRGAIDALFGPGTRRGVAAFQTASALPPTGYLDHETLGALTARSAGPLLRAGQAKPMRGAIHRIAAIGAAGTGLRADPTVVRVAAQSRNADVHAYWDTLALDFEADNPGTQVVFQHQPDWQYKETLLGMLGSAEPPAIIHTWGGGHLKALADAGFVHNLTEAMSQNWALAFRPAALQNFTVGDQLYGVPADMALVGLWVNAPLFARAGIDIGSLRSWDGFVSAVKTLKAQGIVPLAIGGKDHWTYQLIWGNLALSAGGRDAFERAYANRDGGFQSPAFVTASERLSELAALQPFQDNFAQMDEAEAGNAFARGDAAMVITGNWRLHSMGWNWPGGRERMAEELVRIDFPALADRGGEVLTYGGVNGYALNVEAPPIALAFLQKLTSRETQSRISALADDVPSVSGSDLALTDPLVAEVASTILGSAYHQLYYDQALGPIAGEVVNEMAMQLGTGAIDGPSAAAAIDQAWQTALSEQGLGQPVPAGERL